MTNAELLRYAIRRHMISASLPW